MTEKKIETKQKKMNIIIHLFLECFKIINTEIKKKTFTVD